MRCPAHTTCLSATPVRPACPSRASGWSSLITHWGFPCCVRFPCVHAAATTPVQRLGAFLAHLTQPYQPSPEGVAGSACTSTFSGLARRSLALRPAHSRGHQFVTRYPKASDISSPPCLLRLLPAGANRRVGLAPTGKRRLVTAHPHCGHYLEPVAGSQWGGKLSFVPPLPLAKCAIYGRRGPEC